MLQIFFKQIIALFSHYESIALWYLWYGLWRQICSAHFIKRVNETLLALQWKVGNKNICQQQMVPTSFAPNWNIRYWMLLWELQAKKLRKIPKNCIKNYRQGRGGLGGSKSWFDLRGGFRTESKNPAKLDGDALVWTAVFFDWIEWFKFVDYIWVNWIDFVFLLLIERRIKYLIFVDLL